MPIVKNNWFGLSCSLIEHPCGKAMSYFARSSASALITTAPFRTWAEYDAHVVELGKRNAAALAPFGVKTIDAYVRHLLIINGPLWLTFISQI